MKKTLIALAAIAAVGAASAQVTVYGKLDVGVSNTSAGGTVVGVNQWENSRFGIKAEQEVSKGL
ncbi:MAG: porin, partial [Betaproteobacteria bacterium]|nr:porin [Betaproteobacteria bacterium]